MVDDDKNSVNNMTNARKFSLIYHYRVIIEVNRLERPGLGDPPHGAGRCSPLWSRLVPILPGLIPLHTVVGSGTVEMLRSSLSLMRWTLLLQSNLKHSLFPLAHSFLSSGSISRMVAGSIRVTHRVQSEPSSPSRLSGRGPGTWLLKGGHVWIINRQDWQAKCALIIIIFTSYCPVREKFVVKNSLSNSEVLDWTWWRVPSCHPLRYYFSYLIVAD